MAEHCCHHNHHHHIDPAEMSARQLTRAVAANMLLTVVQVVGGLVSGSLSLVADALHNFSDAAALLLALVAVRVGQRPKDHMKTFGYRRAETVAALVNLTALILIGLYLAGMAVQRFFAPQPVEGWTVVAVATVALAVDVYTALLVRRQAKNSMNVRAAFLHNVTDALASVGVIVSGSLILLYGWVWTDAVMTLLISGYVLWHGCAQIPQVIHLLMEGAPTHVSVEDVVSAMESADGVDNVHHVHIWRIDEHSNALEAHVVLKDISAMDAVKKGLKSMLRDRFTIGHSTLEFEEKDCGGTC